MQRNVMNLYLSKITEKSKLTISSISNIFFTNFFILWWRQKGNQWSFTFTTPMTWRLQIENNIFTSNTFEEFFKTTTIKTIMMIMVTALLQQQQQQSNQRQHWNDDSFATTATTDLRQQWNVIDLTMTKEHERVIIWSCTELITNIKKIYRIKTICFVLP